MKQILKSIFNLKTILCCYIGAIGYGVGYNLPNKLNYHPIICLICCLILGTLFDTIANKLLSTKFFNESKKNKIITAVIVYAGYLIAWWIVDKTLNYDLDYDFMTSLYMIIGIQVILLIIKAIKNGIKSKKESKN